MEPSHSTSREHINTGEATSQHSRQRSICIDVQNLRKTYSFGKIHALSGIDLQIYAGDIFALIGPNGAGKTTLMGCLLGLLRPSGGQIRIFGNTPDDLEVRKITGFLPERPYFEAWMTARQFLTYQHMLAKRPASTTAAEVKTALEDVELDGAVADRQIRKFSRGMLQRLGLAQVLIGQPKLCFLDEPASGMDPLGIELVRRLLLRWKTEGVTVILNSHHLDEVERVCNRFAFINKGRIEAQEDVIREEKPALIIRWAQNGEIIFSELLEQTVLSAGCELSNCDQFSARIIVPDKTQTHHVIKSLVLAGIPIEEAKLEKTALVDLFRGKEEQS